MRQAAANRAGGLCADDVEIAFLGDVDPAGGGELIDLALGDDRAGAGQDLQHLEAAILHHQLERPAEQEVADQHAGRVAPDEVGGALATPQVRPIDHIIVQQRGGVDELDRRRQAVVARAAIAEQARARERQHRAHALAAAGDQMAGQLRDQRDLGLHARQDHRVDEVEVTRDQLHHRFERRLTLGIEAVDRGAHVGCDVAAWPGKGKS